MAKKVINIKIKYSISFETQRVFDVAKKIDWFKRMSYEVDLPKDLKIENTKKITKKIIIDAIINEYNSIDYEKAVKIIKQNWDKISSELAKNFLSIKLKPKSSYNIFLTKYGTGGSYNLPNYIIVNFRKRTADDLVRIIIHEIIHLMIEPSVKKNKVQHWQKERLVDLIFSKIMPSVAKMQKLPKEVQKIDLIFNKFFPDIEKFFKHI